MRVWIDLANSPHPLLFEPIVPALEAAGHQTRISYREHAQTGELARERWPGAELVGDASPAGRAAKATVLARRALELRRYGRRHQVELALCHNSYAQIMAARTLAIPIVTGMDFEHQPANHLAFRLADRVVVPAALPIQPLRRQGASEAKLLTYAGYKEEAYLATVDPDPSIRQQIGVDPSAKLVVARSAPTGALYHGAENPLWHDILRRLDQFPNTRTVVLARHPGQRRELAHLGLKRAVVPETSLDSRSLLAVADMFVGAGGTMSREAALLGVSSYSIYANERPSMDLALEREGLLHHLNRAAALPEPTKREGAGANRDELRRRGGAVVERFVEAVSMAAEAS